MYIQCTFHVTLLKVLSQLPDLPERSKFLMLDYSKHRENGLDQLCMIPSSYKINGPLERVTELSSYKQNC